MIGLSLQLRQELNCAQKQELRQLHSLYLQVCAPSPDCARVGLEGIRAADETLKAHGASGLLTGGLLKRIWNRSTRLSDLSAHKDVDVLVFPSEHLQANPITRFESGIDWWLPQSAYLTINTDVTQMTSQRQWWENGHETTCWIFPFDHTVPVQPGLYFPSQRMASDMCWNYALGSIFSKNTAMIDDEVIYRLEDKVRSHVKTVMPSFLRTAFGSRIYDAAGWMTHERSVLSAITSYRSSKDSIN